MRSRLNGLAYLGGALLFMATPPGTLRAQANAGMMQDEKTGMAAVSEPGELHGANGHKAAGSIHVLAKGGRHKIHFTSEFKADPAQDVQVLLSTEARPVSGSVTLARLDRHMGKEDKMGMEPSKDEMHDGSMSQSP